MSGSELRDGIGGARLVICNDYEFELIRQKTGHDEDDVPESGGGADHHPRRGGLLGFRRAAAATCKRCRPSRIVDPTGVGDAFRGGLMKGERRARPARPARRSAAWRRLTRWSTSAARVMPTPPQEFKARYEEHSVGWRA